MFQPGVIFTAATVILSLLLFVSCSKLIWWWFYWGFYKGKPAYPYASINQCRAAIFALHEEIRKHHQGLRGEELVAFYLEKNLPGSYSVFNDVTLYYRGRRVQIDHVVVGPTGVITIETKNITY